MSNKKLDFVEILHNVDLKATPIRLALINFFFKKKGLFTVQEIYDALKKTNNLKSYDLATIYRNMKKFVSTKLVTECVLADGTSRFELRSSSHHHHLVCTDCKRIDPIFYCPIKINIPEEIRKGYVNLSHKLEFYGLCPRCQRS